MTILIYCCQGERWNFLVKHTHVKHTGKTHGKLLLLDNLHIHSNCSESEIFLGQPTTGLQLNLDYLLKSLKISVWLS